MNKQGKYYIDSGAAAASGLRNVTGLVTKSVVAETLLVVDPGDRRWWGR